MDIHRFHVGEERRARSLLRRRKGVRAHAEPSSRDKYDVALEVVACGGMEGTSGIGTREASSSSFLIRRLIKIKLLFQRARDGRGFSWISLRRRSDTSRKVDTHNPGVERLKGRAIGTHSLPGMHHIRGGRDTVIIPARRALLVGIAISG